MTSAAFLRTPLVLVTAFLRFLGGIIEEGIQTVDEEIDLAHSEFIPNDMTTVDHP